MEKTRTTDVVRKELDSIKAKIAVIDLESARKYVKTEMKGQLDEARDWKFREAKTLKALGFEDFYDLYKEEDETANKWVILKHSLYKASEKEDPQMVWQMLNIFEKDYANRLREIDRYGGSINSEKVLFAVENFLYTDREHSRALKAYLEAENEFSSKIAELKALNEQKGVLEDELSALSIEETRQKLAKSAKKASRIFKRDEREKKALLEGGMSSSAGFTFGSTGLAGRIK